MQIGRSVTIEAPAFIIELSGLLGGRKKTGDLDWGKHVYPLKIFLLNIKKKENYDFKFFVFQMGFATCRGEEKVRFLDITLYIFKIVTLNIHDDNNTSPFMPFQNIYIYIISFNSQDTVVRSVEQVLLTLTLK